MPALSGKQKRALRGLGQKLPPRIHMGRAGLTDALVRQAAAELGRHELIKVRLAAEAPPARRAVAADLARAVEAECVGLTGHTALLYRANEQLPPAQRVALP